MEIGHHMRLKGSLEPLANDASAFSFSNDFLDGGVCFQNPILLAKLSQNQVDTRYDCVARDQKFGDGCQLVESPNASYPRAKKSVLGDPQLAGCRSERNNGKSKAGSTEDNLFSSNHNSSQNKLWQLSPQQQSWAF
jgi:hypothetical protein